MREGNAAGELSRRGVKYRKKGRQGRRTAKAEWISTTEKWTKRCWSGRQVCSAGTSDYPAATAHSSTPSRKKAFSHTPAILVSPTNALFGSPLLRWLGPRRSPQPRIPALTRQLPPAPSTPPMTLCLLPPTADGYYFSNTFGSVPKYTIPTAHAQYVCIICELRLFRLQGRQTSYRSLRVEHFDGRIKNWSAKQTKGKPTKRILQHPI